MAVYEMTVSVRTQYLEEQSEPDRSDYVFAYAITIKNTGSIPAQLISRHWVITDANDQVQEVRGLGVVGNQPLLQPGELFEYTSGTSLATPMAPCMANTSVLPKMAPASSRRFRSSYCPCRAPCIDGP